MRKYRIRLLAMVFALLPGLSPAPTPEIDSLKKIVHTDGVDRLTAIRSLQRLWEALAGFHAFDSANLYPCYGVRFVPDASDRESIEGEGLTFTITLPRQS